MLGLRLDHLAKAALAGGGLALTGCPGGGQDTDTDSDSSSSGTDSDSDSDSDPTTTLAPTTDPPPPPADNVPPALIGIEFLDPQILRLTFTEAIAPVEQVNPKRFRLSVGNYLTPDYYGYSRTLYFDPQQFNYTNYCDYSCYDDYDCYYPCYQGPPTPLQVADVLPDAVNPAQAILLLAQPILPSLCNTANSLSASGRGGLLLHYADGGAAQITDLAALPLAPRGKTWVVQVNDTQMQVDGAQFPEMAPLITVPCPL